MSDLTIKDHHIFDLTPSNDLNNYKYQYDKHLLGKPVGAPPKDKTVILDKRYSLDQQLVQGCAAFAAGNTYKAYKNYCSQKIVISNGLCLEGYRWAQKNDEWAGEEPVYYGTSVNAAMKWLRAIGLVSNWYWTDPNGVIDAVVNKKTPVEMGTMWYSGMARPNPQSIMSFSGSQYGGHATAIIGWIGPMNLVVIENSWNNTWGNDGVAYLTWETFVNIYNSQWMDLAVPVFT